MMADGGTRPSLAAVTSPVRRLQVGGYGIYLTFDDGPDAHWTPRILDLLESRQAQASFFVIGKIAAQCAPLLRRMHAAGHAVCNHGWSHSHPWTWGRDRASQEIRDGADAIAQALGSRPAWFRPPHGRLSPWVTAAARTECQRIALWQLSAIDWGAFASPSAIVQRVAAAQRGDIVLMHDGPWLQNRPAHTVRALPTVLERLQRAGIAPLPLPDVTLAA